MPASCPRSWVSTAIQIIEADFNRSSDTHLLRVPLPAMPGVSLYLKDESTHPSGSLKHRLARSLFLYGLCNGWIGPETTIVEASSGSTAVSEAYFARMLGLRFIAVMPRSTSAEKIAQIAFYGGESHFVDSPAQMYEESARLAEELGGHYMDQFTYAERATDWRGNNNIAESIFSQMSQEEHPIPTWIVVGAGTGGTSATLGRYIRYRRLPTRLCLADPEASVFHRHLADRSVCTVSGAPSVIEGIGRPRCEPSFVPELIDRATAVPDAASIAAARVLSRRIGRSCGGSTGTNLWAVAQIIGEMVKNGEQGSVVTLLCDSGERYRSTHFDDAWLACRGIDIKPAEDAMERFFETGVLQSTN
ncbi:PLP-dependent cysteine synthase family protein [Microvirga arsenatis]|uniref:L-cysteine desulfhydrase Cds1 n=1 Tax=Microvirga arsenatis TaxID=2692265 RepID=A0ABW9Z0V1_9HYPH|nr:PLP-dependent cysteine synthase family protein [Microvirga arsenatis]NBJ12354.1 pyridoxal-phosphate dependent enzyme [Microvirga arsenatis]NBJ26145.1 pyridoxal-phosphate dependent enzyme [Microvirga arsenatis]